MTMRIYHPRRHLKLVFPHMVILITSELPAGVLGRWTSRGIEPRAALTQSERRSTFVHEIVHLKRGPAPDVVWLEAREERIVAAIAARRLIELDALVDALAWCQGVAVVECADEVWGDPQTLSVRIATLTDTERLHLELEIRRRHNN